MHGRSSMSLPCVFAGAAVRRLLPAERQVQRCVPVLRRREGVLPGQRLRRGVRAAISLAQPARPGRVRCACGQHMLHAWCLSGCSVVPESRDCDIDIALSVHARSSKCHFDYALIAARFLAGASCAVIFDCPGTTVALFWRRMRRHLPAGCAGEGGRGPQHQAHRRLQERR